jgi:uncharacterized protein YdcH (DUF465 family)
VPNLVEHLKGFELPDKLPTCLKESFGLLAKIEALHEDSRVREKAKRELLARIKKHCFDLQQGLPVVNFTADDHDSHEHREAIYLENQIKQLAQTNPPVQRLLEAYEELHDELNETRARLLDTAPQAQAALSQAQQDLSAARESWKSEVSALVSESEKVKAELAAQLAALASVSEENAKLKEQLNALRSQNGAKKK